MAKPIAGDLFYNKTTDRPRVTLRVGERDLLTTDDASGGTITSITSTGGTVAITNPSGPVVNLEAAEGTVEEITSGDGSVAIANPTGPSVALSVPDRLTRTADDWAPFSLKSPPELDDVLLIEDSADGGAKKRITINDLIALIFPPPPEPFYAGDLMITSGWNAVFGPQALYHAAHDKTYVAWQMVGASGGKGVHIAYYDHATDLWSDRYRVGNFSLADDDHGSPALGIDSDGYIYVFFGSHLSSQLWSISTNANDITEWTQQAALTSNDVTYPKVNIISSTLYLMNRDTDLGASKYPLQIRSGTISAGAVTLGAKKILIDWGADSRFYQGAAHTIGTDLHFIATLATFLDATRKGVYYFRYNTTTGAVTNYNASFSVASGSQPVTLAQSNTNCRIFDHGSNDGDVPVLEFDTNGDAHVLFAVGQNGVTPTYLIKHMYLSGGVWSTPITVTSVQDLVPGPGAGTAFVNAYGLVPGASGTMELWTNNLNRDMIRFRMDASKNWGAPETVISRASFDFEGTVTVRNALPGLRVAFAESFRPPVDANAAKLRMFVYGDSGPIASTIDQTVLDSSIISTRLLLGMNHRDAATTLIDDSPAARTGAVFNGNAQIDTAQKKFGSASLLLDGTGDFVSYPSSADLSGSQTDFTVEAWVRPNESGRLQVVCGKRSSATTASEYEFFKTTANTMSVLAWAAAAAVTINITGTTALSTGTWYHVAVSKSGTTWRLFVDGALEASAVESAGAAATNAQLFVIGREIGSTVRDWNGWIDEIRVTSAARYTATFTAPTTAFPRH